MMNIDLTLAQYRPIATYTPTAGDFIIWHGWFTHYYGVITKAEDNGLIYAIRSGMPNLLFTMNPAKMQENVTKLYLDDVRRSRGSYAILQRNVWYI